MEIVWLKIELISYNQSGTFWSNARKWHTLLGKGWSKNEATTDQCFQLWLLFCRSNFGNFLTPIFLGQVGNTAADTGNTA